MAPVPVGAAAPGSSPRKVNDGPRVSGDPATLISASMISCVDPCRPHLPCWVQEKRLIATEDDRVAEDTYLIVRNAAQVLP